MKSEKRELIKNEKPPPAGRSLCETGAKGIVQAPWKYRSRGLKHIYKGLERYLLKSSLLSVTYAEDKARGSGDFFSPAYRSAFDGLRGVFLQCAAGG